MPSRAIAVVSAAMGLALAASAPANAAVASPPPPLLHALASTPLGRVAVPAASALLQEGSMIVDGALGNSDVLVGLRLRNEAQLDKLIAEVSNPRSKSYRHYLTPAEFRARFAPSQAEADAVSSFARSFGLKVANVPRNRLWVELKGPATAASTAFAAALKVHQLLSGREYVAPTAIPSVPAALTRIVTGIEGLDTSAVMRPMAASSPPAYVNAGPCSSYWGQRTADGLPVPAGYATPIPYVPCGYTPKQLESAYGVSSAIAAGVNGKGVKVGIIDAFGSQTIGDDVNTWSQKHGLPSADLQDITGPLPENLPEVPLPIALIDPDGWAGEETLDVEAVHAMAPGATIIYQGALSALNVAFSRIQNDMVDNARAQIITNSYGGASDDADANTDALLKQAAAQGIGFYFSSGDEGDETKDANGPGDRETDTSANNPMATAVGGTSLAVGKDDDYMFETGWGTYTSTLTNNAWDPAAPGTYLYGGGGGTSQAYAQPDYQKGIVPPAISNYFTGKPAEKSQGNGFVPQIPGRAEPDVAINGDPNTGMLIGETQNFSSAAHDKLQLPGDDVHYSEYRLGGTSLSSPLFAGVMALADQAAGKPHGFVNPALYAAYKANPSITHDVVDPAKTIAAVRVDYKNTLDASTGTNTLLRIFDQTNTLHTIPGYDDVTGLGSPNGLVFLHAMAPGSTILPALPAVACKKVKTTTFKLHIPKGSRLVRVTFRLGKGKSHVSKGRSVKTIKITVPSKTTQLVIKTVSGNHRTSTYHRYVGPCGLVATQKGHAK